MILEVKELNTYYGQSHILTGVNLSLKEGEAGFLLGRNGMGKSTTIHSIMGLVKPHSGSIIYQGSEMIGRPAHVMSRAGVGLVPEGRRIFSDMSVEENLVVAAKKRKDASPWDLDRIYRLFPILDQRRKQEAVTLSGGEQQVLTIARTLMGNPDLLLIDEPTEGLSPMVAHLVCDQLLLLKQHGITMLLTDHKMSLASKLGDVIFFIEKGRTRWSGTVTEALDNSKEDLVGSFLGV
jgi:branched-chain amino acid transport system ATP-binding protein